MSSLPRRTLLDRERTRLQNVAKEQGYDSLALMLHDLYIVQGKSLYGIADSLLTPLWSLRKYFDEVGIKVKSRGGPNNKKVEITEALLLEISRDGVQAVADRLGVNYSALLDRVRRALGGTI